MGCLSEISQPRLLCFAEASRHPLGRLNKLQRLDVAQRPAGITAGAVVEARHSYWSCGLASNRVTGKHCCTFSGHVLGTRSANNACGLLPLALPISALIH